MFIFNMKINKISKILFVLMFLIICAIIIYIIFFNNKTITLSDTIKSDEIFEITSDNYTNILKVANDDIDSYVGCKIHLVGYVYRLLDFNENQFVVARNMLLSDNNVSNALVVGFLSECDNASDFEDGVWVDVTGEIVKGDFNGDIAILKITSIEKTEKPDNEFVHIPDETYIPTASMF